MKNRIASPRLRASFLFLAVILLVLSGPLFARVVMLSEARTAAVRLVALENLRPEMRLTPGTFSVATVRELTSAGQPIGFLAEMVPSGFMILSGVTEAEPEVFISFGGSYASLEKHSLLAGIRAYLRDKRERSGPPANQGSTRNHAWTLNLSALADIARHEQQWSLLLGSGTPSLPSLLDFAEGEEVPPLLTCHWKQGSPFNMYTPWIGTRQPPAGCVAIAMAQVMYYWKYPNEGDGSYQYTWHSQTLSASFAHPYYWDRMLDSYDGYYTTEQMDAVARLVSDVGISVSMDYELGCSGAYLSPRPFFLYFRYATSARHVYRDWIGDWAAWFDLFRQQVEKGQPVILGADKGTSGHAFVVDGCRTSPSDEIHVNMGWGANYDCYTSVESIYGYVIYDAIIDIHPGDVTLTLDAAANGTTEPAAGAYKYPWKTSVTLTAFPDPHFELRDWSGDASGTANPLELMMDRNRRVAANFQRIISAPLNAAGQQILNRSLSQAEYINVLTFQPNPDNIDITGYKVYLVEGTARTGLASLDANTFKYLHRGVARDRVYIYEIVAVNSEPREGYPATVVVQ